jgi:hypothetical protein
MRKTPVIVSATLVFGALMAAPAFADPGAAGETATTFSVAAGVLSISVPATADLGDMTVSTALGTVTVVDERASADASWMISAESTSFVTGGGLPSETIGSDFISYWSGQATATTGDGTFTPGQLTEASAQAGTVTAFTHTGGTGNNSASWNPTIVVDKPGNSQAGVYSGTIFNSAA